MMILKMDDHIELNFSPQIHLARKWIRLYITVNNRKPLIVNS